jgi:post-segregation antitoxin (ccd killing protein)
MRILFLATVVASCAAATAAADIETYSENLKTAVNYGMVIGRGTVCGLNMEDASARVRLWMTRTFDYDDIATAEDLFERARQYHIDLQRTGQAPETCESVLRTLCDRGRNDACAMLPRR